MLRGHADGHDIDPIALGGPWLRRHSAAAFLLAAHLRVLGPAYLVSVGYMDPGNWATDLEGGARFGYRADLGAADVEPDGRPAPDALGAARHRHRHGPGAGLPRRRISRRSTCVLWILAEIAIAACDLAEVLGTIIGLKLLFGMPLLLGRASSPPLDTFLLLLACSTAGCGRWRRSSWPWSRRSASAS